ncbi:MULTISPECIES: hypothetical protein [unclassified Mesorhizobium]|uniref:DUF7940 domain-containing protein n=1 Tax=unclassified Mesorhizobium TaxID=325217 RepID=UPI000FD7B949|nr:MULTISPECIES: hypothetical protein [unclassified Mesorhizobium]TGR58247.1 hypothetical protein EN842_01250 [bacterium M00.F.Ca.ET.199.01.1.1]TGU41645.1 hypothetical protein EN799_03565 [bacterium M00.F.Ca.ET.156.01.1.1]TGV89731.1 hypothetical protein EN792_006120 [Mesorhizobium sp. M00.F.Ca.ET.149.01.1.1]TGR32989.1 hypothetical protein EN840_01250 [Mesorhizobium sp. M8A.F.Ca.ET.197.01.1.1]TGR34635.1 hypothetical protein EN845_01250 [Mesorhizobium sp. M8A.F.Ca.ET.202.01.1.1]
MRLIPDVERVLKRAWSLRLIELAAAVDIILNVVPYMDFLPWWLTLALLGGAWTARLLTQFEKDAAKEADDADKQN